MSVKWRNTSDKSAIHFPKFASIKSFISRRNTRIGGASLMVVLLTAGTALGLSHQDNQIHNTAQASVEQQALDEPHVVEKPKKIDTPDTSEVSKDEVEDTTSSRHSTNTSSSRVTINGENVTMPQNGVVQRSYTNRDGSVTSNITVKNSTVSSGTSSNSNTTDVDFYSSSTDNSYTVGDQ